MVSQLAELPLAVNASPFQSRPMAIGMHGAVSTPHVAASTAAIEMMRSGGNAVDAAVAAASVATVVQPFSSSVGGVGWALVHHQASRSTEVLEFVGAVPWRLDPARFVADRLGLVDWRKLEQDDSPLAGSLTPAVVAGWSALLEKWGTRSLAEVLQPAIRWARVGVPTSELLHANTAATLDRLRRWPASAEIFLRNDEPPPIGSPLVQRDLAETLERIAAHGPAEMVNGKTGQAILQFENEFGGAIEARDLEVIAPRWSQPLETTFRGQIVAAASGPFGDVAFIEGLQLLESFGPFSGALDTDYIHLSVESARLVSKDRARYLGALGDPAAIRRLMSAEHTDELRARIGDRASMVQTAGNPNEDTITLATVDDEGNAVHLMQTVGTFFGTGAVVPGTGVLMNSSLYFAYAEGPGANRIIPGHPIEQNPCIAMVFGDDHELRLVAGSPGGKTRVETVRQLLENVLEFGMNPQQAADAGRFLSAADGSAVHFEQRYGEVDPLLRAALEARGHVVHVQDEGFGSGQIIAIDSSTGARMAGADWRREAVALAY